MFDSNESQTSDIKQDRQKRYNKDIDIFISGLSLYSVAMMHIYLEKVRYNRLLKIFSVIPFTSLFTYIR